MTKQNDLCVKRRLRSAWAFAQSDQSLRCPHEETLGPQLPIERTHYEDLGFAHLEANSHTIIKSHRIFRPSYNTIFEEININHTLLFLSQASYI